MKISNEEVRMIRFILFQCALLFRGCVFKDTAETSYWLYFYNTTRAVPYADNETSQTTSFSTQLQSQPGDGGNLEFASTSGDSNPYAVALKTDDGQGGFISTTINEQVAKNSAAPGKAEVDVANNNTGSSEESRETTDDEQQSTVAPLRPYIEQTGLLSPVFRVNLDVCQRSQTTENISASEGVIELVVSNTSTGLMKCKWFLTVPEGKFIAVDFQQFHLGTRPLCQDYSNVILGIYDAIEETIISFGCGTDGALPPLSYSLRNQVRFQFKYDFTPTGIRDTLAIRLRFNVTSENWRQNLMVVYTSPMSGYVASPGYDGKIEYPNYVNASFTLTPPKEHAVMISFSRIDIERHDYCGFDKLKMIQVNNNGEKEIWTKCGAETFLPSVFNSSVRLIFLSDSYVVKTGFKMLFSFHPYLQTPQEISSGLFNCSVSFYDFFKEHLHCNIERECLRGEDEMSCPYNTESCGDGLVDAGSKCYRFVNPKQNITWNDAMSTCQEYDELLVMMKTPQEWVEFQNTLNYGKRSAYVYVGLSTCSSALDLIYQDVVQWVDGTVAYYVQLDTLFSTAVAPMCFYMNGGNKITLSFLKCDIKRPAQFICESRKKNTEHEPKTAPLLAEIKEEDVPKGIQNISFVKCTNKQISIDFLSCSKESQCNVERYISFCDIPGKGKIPMFDCDDNTQTIPYTFLCDHRTDCRDGSDERFCKFPECRQYKCRNQQCISVEQRCDGVQHCLDRSDEDCEIDISNMTSTLPPPALVNLAGRRKYKTISMNSSEPCPNTHFRCSERDYCLPVYLRCNGVYDCAGREDEMNCEAYTCPGFYRCYSSTVCVHPAHVCDGVFQCPQQDDEMFCQLSCPEDSCRCQGLAFVCFKPFDVSEYPEVRYLDASGTGLSLDSVKNNVLLVSLSLTNCGFRSLTNFTLPNLQFLDLGNNLLTFLEMSVFLNVPNLRYVSLSGNPLGSLISAKSVATHKNLKAVDLSFSQLEIYEGGPFINFPNIKMLNISNAPLTVLAGDAFRPTPYIESLDLRGCSIETFDENVLKELESLSVVYAENYKLCCRATLPEQFDIRNCFTTKDEISSCEDLLQSSVYRIFLWIFSLLAIAGNAGSFVSRLFLHNQASYSIFVMNLNIADLVMGIYLAMIGGADQVYRGNYLWYDTQWKTSPVCKVAGFLCLLSTEVSAFIICLITLDRFLVLRFPFSRIRFRRLSAALACCAAWAAGSVLAAVPLLPMTSHWQFYSQSGICVPLPITRRSFKGHDYSFGIVIVLNFVLFLVIAVGQLVIYHTVRANSLSTASNKNSAELSVARRLTTVVLSDFLCWFPVGFLGLLAASGTPIPGEVNVAMAIFVLPLNAALNPFLYTFNTVMEKRRKAREQRLLKRLESRARSEIYSLPDVQCFKAVENATSKERALKQIKVWLEEKVVTPDDVIKHVKNSQK